MKLVGAIAMTLLSFASIACSRPAHAGDPLPEPKVDIVVEAESDEPVEPRTLVLAGGCFWCTEAVFERLEGVSTVVSGYAGGTADTADYRLVSSGKTDHAEVIAITYDPTAITPGKLLQVFFTTHDPTQLNAQGPDHGRQYRSAVFYANDEELSVAKSYIDQLSEAGVFGKPIVTTLEPLDAFYPAEDYHQDYVKLNPSHPYVRYNSLPKLDKLDKTYPELLKKNDK